MITVNCSTIFILFFVFIFAEVSFTHKVEYKERNGVDYGMAPASTKELRRFGFMRFQSKAVRPIKKNEVKLVSFYYLLI